MGVHPRPAGEVDDHFHEADLLGSLLSGVRPRFRYGHPVPDLPLANRSSPFLDAALCEKLHQSPGEASGNGATPVRQKNAQYIHTAITYKMIVPKKGGPKP